MRVFAWDNIFDRRDHHPISRLERRLTNDSPSHYPKSRERPSHGPALRAGRRRSRADLRPDGRRELRPWRVPDDRDVRDLLPVRVLCRRPVAVGAFGGGSAVRVRRGGLSPDRAFCRAGEGQCRHGADLFDLRARDRHAWPGAVLLYSGLSQRHPFMAWRQDHLGCGHLLACAAIGWRDGGDRGVRRAVFLHQSHRLRPRA